MGRQFFRWKELRVHLDSNLHHVCYCRSESQRKALSRVPVPWDATRKLKASRTMNVIFRPSRKNNQWTEKPAAVLKAKARGICKEQLYLVFACGIRSNTYFFREPRYRESWTKVDVGSQRIKKQLWNCSKQQAFHVWYGGNVKGGLQGSFAPHKCHFDRLRLPISAHCAACSAGNIVILGKVSLHA